MERRTEWGDYTADGLGGLIQVCGTEELLQRAFRKLAARRGAFPLMPQFGSRLYQLVGLRPAQRESAALAWAVEALADEPELAVTAVDLSYPSEGVLRLGVELTVAEESGYRLELEVEHR